ncbi:hypothetical protein [Streptomyces sp. NPDC086777]|uniref:hypothetical protein n=1 Tax=Streptomyces sp. NPDC086777 TaxID=3154866 RepID=UPI003450BCAD
MSAPASANQGDQATADTEPEATGASMRAQVGAEDRRTRYQGKRPLRPASDVRGPRTRRYGERRPS